MQSFDALEQMLENVPDFAFFDKLFETSGLFQLRMEVAGICQLHDDAEDSIFLYKEGLFVDDHVFVPDGGQNPDFIESSLFLFFR